MHSLDLQLSQRCNISLVDSDERGNTLSLPPGLGNLPLHPVGDGWYSVLGSWNGTHDNPETANDVNEVSSEGSADIPRAPVGTPKNSCPSLPSIFCRYHKCSGNSGPHTCAPGRFTCEAPGCAFRGSFTTKQALNKHYLAMHGNNRVDCPVERCVRVGACGIKRADNLAAHLWNKHGISDASEAYRN